MQPVIFALAPDTAANECATSERSSLREVRNPMLALPSTQRLLALPPSQRAVLRAVLLDLQREAREKAELCWRTHKAPMAAYWKAVSVYAGHLAKVTKP
jgi:hypothetical protein